VDGVYRDIGLSASVKTSVWLFSFQKLQQQLDFLEVQEEYIKDEQRNLKNEYRHAQEEVKRIQSVPLVIGQFLEAIDQNTGIVGSTTGI
jgi:26S proteasome regulatory subunit T3